MLKYIDISSSFRNRKSYPLTGEFVIPVNTSPKTNSLDSTDPVILGFPYETNVTGAGSTATDIKLNANSVNVFQFYRSSILEIGGEYRTIINYDNTTQIATVDVPFSVAPAVLTTYTIRKQTPVFSGLVQAGSTSTTIIINSTSPTDIYKGMYLFLSNPTYEYRIIDNYNPTTQTVTIIGQPFTFVPAAGTPAEILSFSYDNITPLSVFTANTDYISRNNSSDQNQTQFYEMKLKSISIPNLNLTTSYGNILNYSHIYVSIFNQNNTNSTILYTNNRNSYKAVFKVPIANLLQSTNFYILDGLDIKQTIRFKPIDDIKVIVSLPNGSILDFIYPSSNIYQTGYPIESNPFTQISMTFEIKRVNLNYTDII